MENENRLLTEQAAQERSNLLKANELVDELRERILNLEKLIENAAQEKNDIETSFAQIVEERDNYKEAIAELKAKLETLVLENQGLEQNILDEKKVAEDLQNLLDAKKAELQEDHERITAFRARHKHRAAQRVGHHRRPVKSRPVGRHGLIRRGLEVPRRGIPSLNLKRLARQHMKLRLIAPVEHKFRGVVSGNKLHGGTPSQ